MSIVPYKDEEAELKRIKKNIENAWEYFKDNYDSFNAMRRFVFVTSMTDADESLNKTLQRPSIEFNILEAYISRLRGEFAKHKPSIMVSGKDGKEVSWELIESVDSHMRYIMYEANKNGFEENTYMDILSGGFTGAKVYTEYTGERSFHQDPVLNRVFDPTMAFWDPMAKDDSKLDGRFCGETFPVYKERAQQEFGIEIDGAQSKGGGTNKGKIKATGNVGNFRWSYQSQGEDVIIICDYYEKNTKKEKILLLTTGQVMSKSEYKKFLKDWESEGRIEQPPLPVGKERTTYITTIVRYRVSENQILEYSETDYDYLPIIYIDGNSILQKDADNSCVRQVTRPIIYQARGAQRLKNFAGQALANELENMALSKWMVGKHSIPDNYKEAWVNPQKAEVLVYNEFKDDDTNVPLPPPIAVQRAPIPPEISQTFMGCDTIIQNCLGTFDPSLAKLGEREVSGIAIQESITLSNSAAMPYVNSYLKGLQAIASNILNLLPKIYKTPRTIPVMDKDGKKSFIKINQEGGIRFDYDKDDLQIKVEAGPSFGAQKAKAFTAMIEMMKVSPQFGQMMSSMGMAALIDNMPDIRNSEQLKEMSQEFMQKMQQMEQKAAQQPNPEQMKMELMQMQAKQKATQDDIENKLEMQKQEIERLKLQVKSAEIMAGIEEAKIEQQIAMQRARTEEESKAADLTIEAMKHADKMELEHKKLSREIDHEKSSAPE